MSKKLLPIISIGLLSVALVACNGKKETAPATPAPTDAAALSAPAPDKLPFDYPSVKADVKVGDTVLAPSGESLANSLKNTSSTSYIYYNGTVTEPGDKATKVKDATGSEALIPNALIIPLKSGESAKAGDIVLTWWQSGSGMERAMVIDGGATPKVNYLDGLSPITTEALKADSFTVLSSDWQVGTTVACKDGSSFDSVILVNVAGDKVLTNGWAGSMKVFAKSDCRPVPVKTSVKVGDTVYVAPYGGFEKATVSSVDAANGKFKAKYDFAGESTEDSFSFGSVLMAMPS
ncbi:hypothetical protein HZA40_05460 [Candidatus Peregrinibacteria bacterium]|nr:hypothetical protein [Candidatus Peregrinibacteria bacterium]